jgi:tape measure domain-containing protein
MEGGDYCMSSKVDDRIVNMKFNNAQFEKGVADTSKSLGDLKKGLTFTGLGKGIGDIAGALKGLSFDGLAQGVQGIASKFSSLSVIGVTALANIANKAIDVGLQMVKSLTIDPIKAGLDEYELKMGSIQTILANTSRYGTQLPEVTANLEELNKYADKTIYNFGEMTKNIGLFTNAGIRIEDATAMIKGFSNEAAASGTNAQGAAGAAYQLSQALSAGTIRLMDWRSLTNVGMGNKNMQNGLIEIADAMGTLEANTTSAEEVQSDFNGSLEKNWLSADVMSTYLKIMSQDTEEAAFSMAKASGLSDEMATSLDARSGWFGLVRDLRYSHR